MTIGEWISIIAALATIGLLITAAVSDILRYRIPNYLVYGVAIAFAVAIAFNFSLHALGWSLAAALGMFALGCIFFALNLFGGGDVKLITAVALWTGVADLMRFALLMSVIGGVLGVIWIIRRRRHQRRAAAEAAAHPGAPPGPARKFKLPYGVAIALAGLDFFVASVHSPLAPYVHWTF
jgi:prepilin peptidase CpaA